MRISKDLHDGLGASLTRINFLAERVLETAAGEPGENARQLSNSTHEMAGSLRDLIWASNPADAGAEGLITRICQQAEGLLGAAGVRCRFDLPDELPSERLTDGQRHHLLLAAKEALNNATRHAHASEVRLHVRSEASFLELIIEDNGDAFDSSLAHSGNGLGNMKSRLASIGGECRIDSTPGTGTRVSLRLPLAQTNTRL